MKRLLLIGGGHSHLAALTFLKDARALGLAPTLVAPSPRLLYSGMMPGWIAGRNRLDDCVIDLAKLCHRSGIEWVEDEITGIDFVSRVAIGRRQSHHFDLASLNVGSDVLSCTGVGDGVTVLGAKPFSDFVANWERWRAQALREARPVQLLVVGGGAAGVELAFALAALVRREAALSGSSVLLAHHGDRLLTGMAPMAGVLAHKALCARQVTVLANAYYEGCRDNKVLFSDGRKIHADMVLLATGATPPGWLSASASRAGFSVTSDGALQVGDDLRVIGSRTIFAAGDCAQIVGQTLPRSGVHALRQGRVLGRNLLTLAASSRTSLDGYRGRHRTLALLDRSDGSAIAAWGRFSVAGRVAWQWKRWIDTRFVAGFR